MNISTYFPKIKLQYADLNLKGLVLTSTPSKAAHVSARYNGGVSTLDSFHILSFVYG